MEKSRYVSDTVDVIREISKTLRFYQQSDHFCNGVTYTQFNILDLIVRNTKMEITKLNNELAIEKSTGSRLIEPLISKSLVTKRRSQDHPRSYELIITEKGLEVYEDIISCISSCFCQINSQITPSDFDGMIRSIRLFLKILNNSCCKR